MKIAVTGASGMLGTAILDYFSEKYTIFATSRSMGYTKEGINWHLFDLLNEEKLTTWLRQVQPEVVIHCAAIIDVDGCETKPIQAKLLHAETTAIIAKVIAEWGGHLIYISTDAVFDGDQPNLYYEEVQPNPRNIYGYTKYQGEIATLLAGGTVLRTTIFGWSRADRCSFSEWILKGLIEKTFLTMFTDVIFTPIHVSHVAEVISKIIDNNVKGLFHLTGSSALTKYDFALKMAEQFDLSAENVKPISIDEIKLLAVRSKNMALANRKLSRALNFKFPTADEGITYLKTQYDNGWVAKIKKRAVGAEYIFWRKDDGNKY